MGSGSSAFHDISTAEVGSEKDVFENEMREVEVTGRQTPIVIARSNNKFYAFSAFCPHQGAPLVEGAFRHGKVRCPLHGACFDAETGDIEDFPGLECIRAFKISKTKFGILRVAIENFANTESYLKPLCKRTEAYERLSILPRDASVIEKGPKLLNQQTIAIIGSGAAGFMCAVTLRQNNFDGRIIMVTSDWFLPYDRTQLTKGQDSQWVNIQLKGESFYEEHDIEVMRNTTVEHVNFIENKLKIADSDKMIVYDKLLIATGMKPRVYDVPGAHLTNIFTIHSLKDVQRVNAKAKGKDVVILGSSFIAMEMASMLDSIAASVVIIGRCRWPFGMVYGKSAGTAVLMHMIKRSKNVQYKMLDEVKSFGGNSNGEVNLVKTMKKQQYKCSIVIVAVGAVANTEFLEKSRLTLINANKSIPVNENMKTSIPNVYAAGDVTTFPSFVSVTGYTSIGHWSVACKHGKLAALNMLGIKTSVIHTTPFHWTTLWGQTFKYCGDGDKYNEVIMFGEPQNMKFCAIYRRDGIILATLTCNADPIASELAFDLEHHIPYSAKEYPIYITEVFPNHDQLLAGDHYIWVKFRPETKEERFSAFDARNLVTMPRDMTPSEMDVTRTAGLDKSKGEKKSVAFVPQKKEQPRKGGRKSIAIAPQKKEQPPKGEKGKKAQLK